MVFLTHKLWIYVKKKQKQLLKHPLKLLSYTQKWKENFGYLLCQKVRIFTTQHTLVYPSRKSKAPTDAYRAWNLIFKPFVCPFIHLKFLLKLFLYTSIKGQLSIYFHSIFSFGAKNKEQEKQKTKENNL